MLLPKTIKTGRASGIVINAPSTEPLFKLSAVPKTNKLRNIYDEIKAIGNINRLMLKF